MAVTVVLVPFSVEVVFASRAQKSTTHIHVSEGRGLWGSKGKDLIRSDREEGNTVAHAVVLWRRMGEVGRASVVANFNRRQQAEAFAILVHGLARG
jgi:hypothetical protein